MTTNGPEIEEDLRRLVAKSAPPGLRERVLGSALEVRRNAALTPWLRIAGILCVALIGLALGLDFFAGKRETAWLAALLDGRPAAVTPAPETRELAEMAGLQIKEVERLVRLLNASSPAARMKSQRDLGEALRGAERMVGI